MGKNYKPTMNNNGERYGMSVVIRDDGFDTYENGTRKRKVLCKCDCGKIYSTRINALRTGNTTSCGCYNKNKSITHGLNNSRIQKIFSGIKSRTSNSNLKEYKYYGGRGIKCEWESLSDFYKDMGDNYFDGATIERIDNNGNYCKDNCKWATMKEQAQNRRHKKFIEYKGIIKSKTEWANFFGLTYHAFKNRIIRCGGFENMILHFKLNIDG